MRRNEFPGRDRKAVRLPGPRGLPQVDSDRHVAVVGGGIAGLAAAMGLAERGVKVTVIEPEEQFGGRVRAWPTANAAGEVTMSRGFHAFFRQYYNLRNLLGRAGRLEELLAPIADYPVVSAGGDRDSFSSIPRTPPFNFMAFVAQSPTFTLRDLRRTNLDAALSLLDVSFPDTFAELNGVSAADFLDRLRFPDRARHLALEVFARSFFADPEEFSAGELVAMFHAYFLGSSEGLLFDVPRDDFNTSLWAPLWAELERLGATRHRGSASGIERDPATGEWQVHLIDSAVLNADAVVLAAGPGATPGLVAASESLEDQPWRDRVAAVGRAPEFAVWRFWTDRQVREDRAPFLATAGFGPLDNISVLERFERGARDWSRGSGGSVIELHAYALPGITDPDELRAELRREAERAYPELRGMKILAEEFLIERDCALIGPGAWEERPGVRTPFSGLCLAGDWVRCDLPNALMERAATTGWMAANEILGSWNVAGHDLWSVPTRARQAWPGTARSLIRRLPGTAGQIP